MTMLESLGILAQFRKLRLDAAKIKFYHAVYNIRWSEDEARSKISEEDFENKVYGLLDTR